MDNLNAQRHALQWLSARVARRLQIYRNPTNSWRVDLIESYFAARRSAMDNTDYRTLQEITQGLLLETDDLNQNPRPVGGNEL